MHLARPVNSHGDPVVPVIEIVIALSDAGQRSALANSQPTNTGRFSVWITPESHYWFGIAPLVTHLGDDTFGENPDEHKLVLNAPFEIGLDYARPTKPYGHDEVLWRRPRLRIAWGSEPRRIDEFLGETTISEIAADQWDRAHVARSARQGEVDKLIPEWAAWWESYLRVLPEAIEFAEEAQVGWPEINRLRRVFREVQQLDLVGGSDADVATQATDELITARVALLNATKKASAARQELEEATEWVQRRGSSRLRKAYGLGLLGSSLAVYRDERLRDERRGWKWLTKEDERALRDILNPDEVAMDAFALAALYSTEVQLQYRQAKEGRGGEAWLVDQFLGRRIGVPTAEYRVPVDPDREHDYYPPEAYEPVEPGL